MGENVSEKVKLIITNPMGFQKSSELPEGLHWVGSSVNAHIQFPPEEGLAPYHLQIVNAETDTAIRVINLSGDEIPMYQGLEREVLAAGEMIDILGSETLHVGTYTIAFDINKGNRSGG